MVLFAKLHFHPAIFARQQRENLEGLWCVFRVPDALTIGPSTGLDDNCHAPPIVSFAWAVRTKSIIPVEVTVASPASTGTPRVRGRRR